MNPATGKPSIGTRRLGRGGTNDPGFKQAESNLADRAALREQIASSHTATAATKDATGATTDATTAMGDLQTAVESNLAVQKDIMQMTATEANNAAKAAGVLTLEQQQRLAQIFDATNTTHSTSSPPGRPA